MGGPSNPVTQKAWRLAHKQELKIKDHQKYLKNREKVIARSTAYWASHPDKQKETLRRFKEKNPEAYKKYQREWARRYKAKHPEKIRAAKIASEAKRRARKLSTQVDTSGIAQWMKEILDLPFVRCHWCGEKVKGRKVHFDHVIPLAKGGAHTISNICASCARCNLQKRDKPLDRWLVNGQKVLPL